LRLYSDGMVERLTVIFFIILCLLLGINLILLPWISVGMIGDWGDNYLLAFLAEKTGSPIIQQTVASTWFRGAVTGLGVVNIIIAFWEIMHFEQSVQILRGNAQTAAKKRIYRLDDCSFISSQTARSPMKFLMNDPQSYCD